MIPHNCVLSGEAKIFWNVNTCIAKTKQKKSFSIPHSEQINETVNKNNTTKKGQGTQKPVV